MIPDNRGCSLFNPDRSCSRFQRWSFDASKGLMVLANAAGFARLHLVAFASPHMDVVYLVIACHPHLAR